MSNEVKQEVNNLSVDDFFKTSSDGNNQLSSILADRNSIDSKALMWDEFKKHEYTPSESKAANGIYRSVVRLLPNLLTPENIISSYVTFWSKLPSPYDGELKVTCYREHPGREWRDSPYQLFANYLDKMRKENKSAYEFITGGKSYFFRSRDYYAYVQVLEDTQDAKLVGEVKHMRFGSTLYKMIYEIGPDAFSLGFTRPLNIVKGLNDGTNLGRRWNGYEPDFYFSQQIDFDTSEFGIKDFNFSTSTPEERTTLINNIKEKEYNYISALDSSVDESLSEERERAFIKTLINFLDTYDMVECFKRASERIKNIIEEEKSKAPSPSRVSTPQFSNPSPSQEPKRVAPKPTKQKVEKLEVSSDDLPIDDVSIDDLDIDDVDINEFLRK